MIPLEKFGNYEYAENYCRNRNSKIGHNLVLISEVVIAAIIQSGSDRLSSSQDFTFLTMLKGYGP